MTNRELAAALRLCGNHKISEDECHRMCPFAAHEDADHICVEILASACADALANSETHVLALQKEIEKLRKQVEIVQAERDAVHKHTMKLMMERKTQWVSVKEQLPKMMTVKFETRCGVYEYQKSRPVLGADEDGEVTIVCIICNEDNERWWEDADESGDSFDIAYWMPFPEPPSTEGVE